MARTKKGILGIDWGSKYVGVAYMWEGEKIVFPVGYLMNDQVIFFHIGELIQKYSIKTIVIGRPSKQEDIQAKIEKFMENLSFIIGQEDITIEKMEEDYSSVEAGDIISNTHKDIEAFKKNPLEDTISAMVILERWNTVGGIKPVS
ncbi:MAG: RuvX/YqgF family protein [Candidatus Absconditabacteria bacterium]